MSNSNVSKKFAEFLEKNPKSQCIVFEGKETKGMMFDGGTIVVQISDLTFVRIGNEVFETHVSFYDDVFKLLQKNQLMS